MILVPNIYIMVTENPKLYKYDLYEEHMTEETKRRLHVREKLKGLYRSFEIQKSMPKFQAKVKFDHDRQDIPLNYILH